MGYIFQVCRLRHAANLGGNDLARELPRTRVGQDSIQSPRLECMQICHAPAVPIREGGEGDNLYLRMNSNCTCMRVRAFRALRFLKLWLYSFGCTKFVAQVRLSVL